MTNENIDRHYLDVAIMNSPFSLLCQRCSSIFSTMEQNRIQSLVTSYQKLLKITLWHQFCYKNCWYAWIIQNYALRHELWERSDQVFNLVLFDSKKNIAVISLPKSLCFLKKKCVCTSKSVNFQVLFSLIFYPKHL